MHVQGQKYVPITHVLSFSMRARGGNEIPPLQGCSDNEYQVACTAPDTVNVGISFPPLPLTTEQLGKGNMFNVGQDPDTE